MSESDCDFVKRWTFVFELCPDVFAEQLNRSRNLVWRDTDILFRQPLLPRPAPGPAEQLPMQLPDEGWFQRVGMAA